MAKQKTHKGAMKRGYKPPQKRKNNKEPYIEKRIRNNLTNEKNINEEEK